MQSSNILNNPATRKNQPMQHVRQSSAKRTLGVICCPDGYGKAQICHSLQKAREFIGKFRNSSLSCHSKWVAVESVVSPAILFPLANTFYSKSDIQPVEAIISRLWCAAFFLGYPAWTNVSGRERDPVSKTKEAKNRINDILNNICHPSMISKKNWGIWKETEPYGASATGTWCYIDSIPIDPQWCFPDGDCYFGI